MAVFERLKRRMALRKGIRTTYQPFFDSAGDQLRTFTVVQKAVPQNVVELYEEILHLKGKRYKKLREDYERFLTRVEAHNKTVSNLQSRLGSLDLDAFLADPSIWDSSFVEELKESLTKAKGLDFAIKDPYWPLYERASDYAFHSDEIKRQHSIYGDIQSLKKEISSNDGFIRHDKVLDYLSKRDEQRVALGKPEKTYYDFDFLDRLEGFLAGHNSKIAAREASLPLFDNIGGFSLDSQQRRAAVAGERNALVAAAAGSGKTMTICGRLKYLVERAGVSPSKILLLSYSKKSADDLAKRAEEVCPGVIAQTFHKTGLDILKTASDGQFVVEEQFDAIVETYFREELFNDPSALRDVLIYYGLFLNNGETVRKYHDEGELFADLKKDDFVTFKESLLKLSRDPSAMETIKREKVKSFEEMASPISTLSMGSPMNTNVPTSLMNPHRRDASTRRIFTYRNMAFITSTMGSMRTAGQSNTTGWPSGIMFLASLGSKSATLEIRQLASRPFLMNSPITRFLKS